MVPPRQNPPRAWCYADHSFKDFLLARILDLRDTRPSDVDASKEVDWHTQGRLCRMNLAVRSIDAEIRWNNEGSIHEDRLRDLKADFIPKVEMHGTVAPSSRYCFCLPFVRAVSPFGHAGIGTAFANAISAAESPNSRLTRPSTWSRSAAA